MNDDISVDDDFLNIRFDPKFKQIFKEKIESLQGESVAEDYLLPVRFVGSYSNKTKKYLNTMVSRVTVSAGVCGLRLRKSDPEIVFYTAEAWPKNKNDELNLPASTITWQGNQPIIQVVTPTEIDSSEILIKTVRLLFSKLFGTLFFGENVSTRRPYFFDSGLSAESGYDATEKLHFNRLLDDYPPAILEQIKNLALNKKLGKDKLIESGKNEFYKLLKGDIENPNSIYLDMLNSVFSNHLQSAKDDSQTFFDKIAHSVFEALPKLGLILPHELRFFNSLKSRSQWQLFDGIAEKAQYVKGCIEDLNECFSYLEDFKTKEITDYSTSDYWKNVLNNRIVHLKRKGLVKLFLIDDSRLTVNQQKDMLEFPLWVWRQRLFKNYPKSLPANKVLQTITSHYKNSIYQKILEGSFRAVNILKSLQSGKKNNFSESNDYKRLHSLMAGIGIRIPIINDVLHTSRLAPQMVKIDTIDRELILKGSKQFEQGWSYFISFALIHQFYLSKQSIADDKATRFLKIIKQHLEKKLENQISFQISYLLLHIYLNSHYKMDKLLNIVIDGSDTFDFFVLQHNKIKYRNITVLDVIKNYSKSILK